MPQESSWRPQEAGVHQICYLLAQVQKPGTDQGQVYTSLTFVALGCASVEGCILEALSSCFLLEHAIGNGPIAI